MKKAETSTRALAISAFVILAAVSCREAVQEHSFDTVYYSPAHASGFEIVGMKDSCSRVVRVSSSWQGDSPVCELFIARNGETPPEGFQGQVLADSARRIAAMSSSHIALLDLAGKVSSVCAVSGMKFISNSHIRGHKDIIADIWNEADADFEKLAASRPDIVLLYGISSSSAMEGKLRELGIPFIYIGEYLEHSPLGRTEWVVALAEIAGCREKGEQAFREIESRYEELKSSVPRKTDRPETMLNSPYGDTWYMAPDQSAMVSLIRDAGGEYAFRENKSGKSVPIDLEKAFILTSEADFWLNAGSPESFMQFLKAHPEFTETECVADGNVYSCDRRMTDGGGSDFWETGAARPDLVLEDLIRIFNGCSENLHFYFRIGMDTDGGRGADM